MVHRESNVAAIRPVRAKALKFVAFAPTGHLLLKFLLYIKARAILAGELIVPMNRCLGIFLLQLLNERFQRRLLLWCSGILRLAILGKAADVAYADAHGVVTLAVGAHLFY